MPGPLKLFLFAIVYSLLGNFVLSLTMSAHVFFKQWTALIIGILWLCGWVWGVGALMAGPREGLILLRTWVGTMLGLLIVTAPIALFPHPLFVIGGVILGFGVASWIMTGNADWIIKS